MGQPTQRQNKRSLKNKKRTERSAEVGRLGGWQVGKLDRDRETGQVDIKTNISHTPNRLRMMYCRNSNVSKV